MKNEWLPFVVTGGGIMLNRIWAGMILTGVAYGMVTGNLEAVSNGFLESAGEAVSMCLTMLGVIGFWMGLMEVGRKAGMISRLSGRLEPVINFLFPDIPQNHRCREYITANIIANILGLGWAATPPGLKAMEELANLEKERNNPEYLKKGSRRASQEMCTFLVINISSLQLIPINVIAYRSRYGSVNPTAIVAPAVVATLVSTLTGIVFCKMAVNSNEKS